MSGRGIRQLTLAATVVAGLLVGVGYAFGQGPFAAGGTIQACVNAHGGVTIERPIGPNSACVDPEKPLSWNIQGIQGPKGPTGATGATGPTGATGSQGVPGTARAWAAVASDATIKQQVNVTSVDKEGTGVYCVFLNGIDATQVAAVATSDTLLGVTTIPGGCFKNSVKGVEVYLWDPSTKAVTNGGFSILIP